MQPAAGNFAASAEMTVPSRGSEEQNCKRKLSRSRNSPVRRISGLHLISV